MNACPFVDGIGRSVRFVSGTSKTINHGLGVPAGFIVIRPNYDGGAGSPTFREDTAAIVDANMQLAIIASANCDVDVWFYPRASKTIDVNTGVSA